MEQKKFATHGTRAERLENHSTQPTRLCPKENATPCHTSTLEEIPCESSSVRRRLSWIQNELLYPPIVHIRDEHNVFGGTSESMRPVELLRSTAGFAQHS